MTCACVGLATSGCARRVNPLEPAPTETAAVTAGEGITETDANVKVTAAVDAWNGRESVLDDVTPVLVTIKNDSDKPLRVRYGDFELVDERGTEYAALPLYRIEGQAVVAISDYYYEPVPALDYDNYYVAAPYQPYYPGMDVYDPAVGYDYGYGYYDYGGYYDYWSTVQLPTRVMVNRAIPEGTVAPGGYISGFLYFQRVQPDESNVVEMSYDLVNADTGEEFGEVSLAFRVTKP